MPTPFSEVLERCISGEGRAKLRNWLASVLLPLLDGEAEPAESLANYVLLLLEANHASPEEGLNASKDAERMGFLRDQLADKLTEFLEGESRNFVGRLLREMKIIAGLHGRGKEGRPRRGDYTSRRRDSGGEWVPRGGERDNSNKKLSSYVDDHEYHKRPRHANWGGEERKIPFHQKPYDGWNRGSEHSHTAGRGARDHDQGGGHMPDRGSGGQAGGPEVDRRGWGQPCGLASNVKGDESGNVPERGGEYIAEGGMNQRNRREPGPPHDIGSGQMRGDTPGLGGREETTDRRLNGRSGPIGGTRMAGPFAGQGGTGNWGGGMMMPPHPARPPGGPDPRGGGWGPAGRMGPGRPYIGGPGTSYPGMVEPWSMGPRVGVGGRGGGGPGGQGGYREMYDPLNPEMGGGARRPRFGGPFDGGGGKMMGGGPPWGGMARGGGIAGSHRHQGGGGGRQHSPSLSPEKRSTIRVQGLPTVATSANLTSHFKTFGRVVKVELKTNADGTPSGVAFVQFVESSAAKQARESPIPVLNNRFVKVMILEWNLVDLEKLEAEEKIQQKAKVNATAEVIRVQKEKVKAMQVESLAQQKLSNIERKLSLNQEMLEMLKVKSEPEEEIVQVDEKVQELEHTRDLCKTALADASAKVTIAAAAVDKAEADAKLLGAHVPLDKTASNTSDASKFDKSATPVKGLGRKGSRGDLPSPIGSGGAGVLFARKSIDNRTTCILVKGVPPDTEEGHLRAHFVVYGEIGIVNLQPSGDSAVIKFNTRKAAELAMRKGSAYSGGLTLEMNWIDDSAVAAKNVGMSNDDMEEQDVPKDISASPIHDLGVKWKELEHHSPEETVRRGEMGDVHNSSKAENGNVEKEGSPQHLDSHGEKQQASNHQEEDEEEVVVL